MAHTAPSSHAAHSAPGMHSGAGGSSDPMMAHSQAPPAHAASAPDPMQAHAGTPAAHANAAAAQDPMAAMQAATVPGAHAGNANPGGDNAGAGGDGGVPSANQFPEGTAEHALVEFLNDLTSENYEAAARLVGDKATGLLADVRSGDITDNTKERAKSLVKGLTAIGAKPAGRGKQFNMKNSAGKIVMIKVDKVEGNFLITDLEIRDAPPKRR